MSCINHLHIFIVVGLLNALPVRACTETTRRHEYQCNTYYKCLEISANEYFWMPMHCGENLIYVHKLGKCVLLNDNLECQDNAIAIEEQTNNASKIQNYNSVNDYNDLYVDYDDGSGNGSELINLSESEATDSNDETNTRLQKSTIDLEKSSKTDNIDSGLTTHLQRLSQLVNGLSKTYQAGNGVASELRPDQLNAFLTLFNIRNQFYSIGADDNKEPLEQRQKFLHPSVYHQQQQEMRIPMLSNMYNELTNNPASNIENNYLPHPLAFGVSDDFNDKDDFLEEDVNYVPPIPNKTLQSILELSNQLLDSNGLPYMIPYPSQHPMETLKDYTNNYPSTYDMPVLDQNVGIYKPSKMERRNPSQTTTIIHNNLIPFHIFSSGTNDRPLVDSYGQQLDAYPPLGTNLNRISDHSNTSPKNTIDSNKNYNRFSPLDEHPITDIISTFHTPSLHLNDENVNTIFQRETDPNKIIPKWQKYYSNPAYQQHSSHIDQAVTASAQQMLTLNKPYLENKRFATKGLTRTKPIVVQNQQITHPHSGTQIVNIGGNSISVDTLLDSIRNLLTENNTTSSSNVQVINCASGNRQANITDCTRYYVCSKTTNKILSYSCPPYTAFNMKSRICDSNSYIMCTNYQSPLLRTYTISDNKRLQMLGLQALQDLKYMKSFLAPSNKDSKSIYNITNSFTNRKKPNKSTLKKNTIITTISSINTEHLKDCQEGDKISDPTSQSNYFVCYKTPEDKEMKYLRLSCTKGLIFCSQTNICTLPIRCL